jgi:hypothetical protein
MAMKIQKYLYLFRMFPSYAFKDSQQRNNLGEIFLSPLDFLKTPVAIIIKSCYSSSIIAQDNSINVDHWND